MTAKHSMNFHVLNSHQDKQLSNLTEKVPDTNFSIAIIINESQHKHRFPRLGTRKKAAEASQHLQWEESHCCHCLRYQTTVGLWVSTVVLCSATSPPAWQKTVSLLREISKSIKAAHYKREKRTGEKGVRRWRFTQEKVRVQHLEKEGKL